MHSDLNKSYETARKQGQSFCLWRLPGESELKSAGPAPETIWDGKLPETESFVFAPFNLARYPVYMIGKCGLPARKTDPPAPEITNKKHFLDHSEQAIHSIKEGVYRKIVGARVHQENQDNFDPIAHFLSLCKAYPEAFCYLWHSPSTGTWLGASPELLLGLNGNRLRTMALAGTRSDGQEVFGAKEEEEQGLVLEYLKTVLAPWLKETRIAEQTRAQSGHLFHLKNEVEGELKGDFQDISGLLNSLHPTPAVAGLPKSEAIQFIEKGEGFDRSYYSGFLGTISGGKSDLFVNLRCMQLLLNTQYVYVGAGLTAHSDPEKEWQETEEKTKVVLLR